MTTVGFSSNKTWPPVFHPVISLDTLGEEDTESMIMVEPAEEAGVDDSRSLVIIGPPGPPGQESPTNQTPKRSPPAYNRHGGLKKRRRGTSSQPKQLANKPQDIQVQLYTVKDSNRNEM